MSMKAEARLHPHLRNTAVQKEIGSGSKRQPWKWVMLLVAGTMLISACDVLGPLLGISSKDLELDGTWQVEGQSSIMTISNTGVVMGDNTANVVQYDNFSNTLIVYWTNNSELKNKYEKWHWPDDPGDTVTIAGYRGWSTKADALADTVVMYPGWVFKRIENGSGNQDSFSMDGTIAGAAVKFTSHDVGVSTINTERGTWIRIQANDDPNNTAIDIDYGDVLAYATYYDADLGYDNGIVRFAVLGKLVQQAYGFADMSTNQGKVTISQYDGERFAGTFDVIVDGSEMSGSFDVPFTPTDDPGYGSDGKEPVAQPDSGGAGGDTGSSSGEDSGGSTVNGSFHANGTIGGQAVTIDSEGPGLSVATVDNYGATIRIGVTSGGQSTYIEFDYTAVMTGRTYYDGDLDPANGIVNFVLLSDLIQPDSGLLASTSSQGSFSISRYDGERLAGTFDVVLNTGGTVSGSFDAPFTPTDDSGYGSDGKEPVAQPDSGGINADGSGSTVQ